MKKATRGHSTAAKRAPRGRASKFSEALATEICARLSTGEPLAAICRSPHMPDPATVWTWTKRHETFGQGIARAREMGFDAIAAECLEIANTPLQGTEETSKEWGTEVKKSDMLGHRRLQIDTRLKLLAKWDPKRYGDRIDVNANHTGSVQIIIGGNV